MEYVEDMSLDDIIQSAKEDELSSPPGSVVSYQASMKSGISLGRGARRGITRPNQPLAYDWTWMVGEEVVTREVPPDTPRTFFRGRGGWKVRGNRGRGFPYRFGLAGRGKFQLFHNRPYLNSRPFRGRGRGGRGLQHRAAGFRPRFMNEENKLPVHQRLGWLTPARRFAIRSVKTATQHLNRRPLQVNLQMQRYIQNDQRGLARFEQLRAYRHMHEEDDDAGSITVSVTNDLALRPQRRGRGARPVRGRGGRAFAGVRFQSQLSRQNVAQLAGREQPRSASNMSMSRFSVSNKSRVSIRSRGSTRSRSNGNRRLFDMRQLPSSGQTASLHSVQRHIHPSVDGFVVPFAPHTVRLDKAMQAEIISIQSKRRLENQSLMTGGLEYKPVPYRTTTSTSDRFSLMC